MGTVPRITRSCDLVFLFPHPLVSGRNSVVPTVYTAVYRDSSAQVLQKSPRCALYLYLYLIWNLNVLGTLNFHFAFVTVHTKTAAIRCGPLVQSIL